MPQSSRYLCCHQQQTAGRPAVGVELLVVELAVGLHHEMVAERGLLHLEGADVREVSRVVRAEEAAALS